MTPREPVHARRISEVITQLDDIIAWSIVEGSRLGFFATLYRLVTLKVSDGIQKGRFEDGPRMERLDVIFANRYLAAFEQFHHREPASQCWQLAFQATSRRRPVIVQHLLLGMNAHINFDLGIAVAESSRGTPLAALRRDFDLINDILAEAMPQVIQQLGALSPLIGHLDRIDPGSDRALINFSLVRARAYAWKFGADLTALKPAQWPGRLALADREIALLGALIENPLSLTFRAGLATIRASESNDVRKIINGLNGTV